MADVINQDQQLNAEQAVIGSMLIDESIVGAVLGKVDARDFLAKKNRIIFQAARDLFRTGSPVDPITIRGKVGEDFSQYMLDLMDVTPTAANWEVYANVMHEQATLSRIKELADQMADATTLDDCRPLIAKLGDLLATGSKIEAWTMKDALAYFTKSQGPDAADKQYISYGIREVDEGSFTEHGDVVMIGGYPSAGKTAFSLALAYNMAKTHNVGYFSFETKPAKLTDRLATHSLQIGFDAIKRKALDESDWVTVAEKGEEFISRNLTFIAASGMTVSQIESVSRAYGFDVIYIDYVQQIKPETDSRLSRTEQVAEISRELHVFAQTSGTLVVELAQLTRADKSSSWREPDMFDLKESGQFEQDADGIMLLFRPDPKSDYDQQKTRILKIAKNKEGRLGKWPLFFDGNHQTFSVMIGEDSKAVMQKFSDMAKKEKMARHLKNTQIRGQQKFEEIPDDGKGPF
ncbi:MAG: replicative DNA helicase [Eubacteriales bacterium]|nr:replicative DNA helicase [Eubacteriales bacterium]